MKNLKRILTTILALTFLVVSLTSCDKIDTSSGFRGFVTSLIGDDNFVVDIIDKIAGDKTDDSNSNNENSNDNSGDNETPDSGNDDNINEDNSNTDNENNNNNDSIGNDDNNGNNGESDKENVDDGNTEYTFITIAEALELCGEPGNITTERYYIKATVKSIMNPSYGEMTIQDETGEIYVYGTYSADGSLTFAQLGERPVSGDEVILHCILQNFDGTKEVKNARLIEFTKGELDVNPDDYAEMSIADARAAAKSSKVKVSGVVAQITYANGMIPSGFILVDTTSSIYVYGIDATSQVSVGNTVTVLADKDYWILESEQSNADKFGYEGCCQLSNAELLENDKGNSDFDKSWITETTVKSIMETPLSDNITSKIFKVTALVKEAVGTGFTNYYFDDLDGVTGSYVYTQCNGNDLDWLKPFDGKICTVYLTVLNAKSTAAECVYRFLPVDVLDEGYTFNPADAPKFAVDYYALGQFKSAYTGDPVTELITSLSSELLGFDGLTMAYSSDNTNAVYFADEDGKKVMHCQNPGTANITITATLGDYTYSETIEITVSNADSTESGTVADAIAAEIGQTLVVKGIVGPSLVNKTGFYLFDDDNMIAVLATEEVMAELEIGYEVVIEATRDRFCDSSKGDHYGQTTLNNAKIVANYYGNYAYSTKNFIYGKTLADFYNLDKTKDHSTEVYVLEAKINFVSTGYYTKLTLLSANGQTEVSVYCSGASQYSWLEDYYNQVVTIELAPCNWNNKSFYAGCILAVYTDNGKIVNNLNFN